MGILSNKTLGKLLDAEARTEQIREQGVFDFLKKEGLNLKKLIIKSVLLGIKEEVFNDSMNLTTNGKIMIEKFELLSKINTGTIITEKLESDKYQMEVEEDFLVMKYNGIVAVKIYKEKFISMFLTVLKENLSLEGKAYFSTFSKEEWLNVTTEVLFENKNTIIKNNRIFASKGEVDRVKKNIETKINELKLKEAAVEKLLKEDQFPDVSFTIKDVNQSKSFINEDDSPEPLMVNASGEIVYVDGDRRSLSETVEIFSSYFSKIKASSRVDSSVLKERIIGSDQPGQFSFHFKGDIVLIDRWNKYYIKMSEIGVDAHSLHLVLNKETDSIVFLDIPDECSVLKIENGIVGEELQPNVLENLKKEYIGNNKEKILFKLVDPSYFRNIDVEVNCDTVLNKHYKFKKTVSFNEGRILDLTSRLELDKEPFVGYNDFFTALNKDASDINFSKKISFGFLSENQTANNSGFTDEIMDFSKGLLDKESGTFFPIEAIKGGFQIPAIAPKEGKIIDILRIGEVVLQASYKETSSKHFLNIDNDEIEVDGFVNVEIEFEILIKEGKTEKTIFKINGTELSASQKNIVEKLLKAGQVLDEVGNPKALYFKELSVSKETVNKPFFVNFNIYTDSKEFRMTRNLVLKTREMSEAEILVDGTTSTILNFVKKGENTIFKAFTTENINAENGIKDVYSGKNILIGFSNPSEIMGNIEINEIEISIFDGLNFNVCKDATNNKGEIAKEYKSKSKEIKAILKRSGSSFVLDEENSSIDEKYLTDLAITYNTAFSLFEEGSTLSIKYLFKRALGNDLTFQRNVLAVKENYIPDYRYNGAFISSITSNIESGIKTAKAYWNEDEVIGSVFKRELSVFVPVEMMVFDRININMNLGDGLFFLEQKTINVGDEPAHIELTENSEHGLDEIKVENIRNEELLMEFFFKRNDDGFITQCIFKSDNNDAYSEIGGPDKIKRWIDLRPTDSPNEFKITFFIFAKNFEQEIKIEMKSETLSGKEESKTIIELIRLDLESKFKVRTLKNVYTKAENTPEVYLLSSEDSPDNHVLKFIKKIKFLVKSSNLKFGNSIGFCLVPLSLSDDNKLVFDTTKLTDEDDFFKVRTFYNYDDKEDYTSFEYEIDFEKEANKVLRGFTILPFIEKRGKENAPQIIPVIIKLASKTFNITTVEDTIVARDYDKLSTPYEVPIEQDLTATKLNGTIENISLKYKANTNSGVTAISSIGSPEFSLSSDGENSEIDFNNIELPTDAVNFGSFDNYNKPELISHEIKEIYDFTRTFNLEFKFKLEDEKIKILLRSNNYDIANISQIEVDDIDNSNKKISIEYIKDDKDSSGNNLLANSLGIMFNNENKRKGVFTNYMKDEYGFIADSNMNLDYSSDDKIEFPEASSLQLAVKNSSGEIISLETIENEETLNKKLITRISIDDEDESKTTELKEILNNILWNGENSVELTVNGAYATKSESTCVTKEYKDYIAVVDAANIFVSIVPDPNPNAGITVLNIFERLNEGDSFAGESVFFGAKLELTIAGEKITFEDNTAATITDFAIGIINGITVE